VKDKQNRKTGNAKVINALTEDTYKTNGNKGFLLTLKQNL